MKIYACLLALTVLVVILCDPTRASLHLRVRRQGWEWGQGGNDNQQQPDPSSSDRPFPTGAPPPFTTTTSANQVAANNARILQCIASCPATPQWNPVCGTDNQNYNNEGRLNCARDCGQTVEVLHLGTCAPNS